MIQAIWDAATRGDFMYAALALFAAAMGYFAFNDARKARAGTLEPTWTETHPESLGQGAEPASKAPEKASATAPALVPLEGPSVDLGDLDQARDDGDDDRVERAEKSAARETAEAETATPSHI